MKRILVTFLLVSLFICQLNCVNNVESSDEVRINTVQTPTPIVTPAQIDSSVDVEKIYTDKENFNYKNYNISKRYKKRKFPNGEPVDVVFAVIKRGNKRIYRFDTYLDSYLREIRFGLFPLLGDENNKQLIIESTYNKYWRYAIINLSPRFEVLFDSDEYPLTHDLNVIDINKDGKYEVIQDLSTFDYFGVSYRKGYAVTPIIFSYDKAKRKYIFANRKFADYLLKPSQNESSIEDKIAEIKQVKANKADKMKYNDEMKYNFDLYMAVMDVFLTYMYLGKENEAWAYFDEYDSPDKEEVRAEIKKYLAKDNLYKYSHSLNQ